MGYCSGEGLRSQCVRNGKNTDWQLAEDLRADELKTKHRAWEQASSRAESLMFRRWIKLCGSNLYSGEQVERLNPDKQLLSWQYPLINDQHLTVVGVDQDGLHETWRSNQGRGWTEQEPRNALQAHSPPNPPVLQTPSTRTRSELAFSPVSGTPIDEPGRGKGIGRRNKGTGVYWLHLGDMEGKMYAERSGQT